MKHPALARVFAIVLALLSAFMLINGALGFGKADGKLQESLEYCQRIEDKLAEYEELDAKLENSISYDEAYEELERLQDEHDEEAAQHRTDLATHTATMGGYTMGVDMIRDGKAQLELAKQELESGKKQLEEQETALNQGVAAFESGKPMMEAGIAELQQPASLLKNIASENIPGLMAELDAVIAQKPEHPGDEPAKPTPPVEPVKPEAPGEDATEEEKAQYEEDLATYEELKAQYDKDLATYEELKTQYDKDKAAYDDALKKYSSEYPAWQSNAAAAVEKVNGELQQSQTTVDTLVMSLNAAVEGMRGISSELVAGISTISVTVPSFESGTDLETVRAGLEQYKQELLAAAEVPNTLQANLAGMESKLQEGKAALEAAKLQVTAGEQALKKGENELQHQLELLWYNMGQLEDEAEELEENKEKLDAESDKLDKMLVSVDELKELENDRRAARIILMQENEIETMVNEGGDLGESTRTFLEQHRSEAEYDHRMLYMVNILAVIGGVFGVLCIVGSYELLRSRVLLIVPPLLCLLCAVGAYGLNLYQGLGQMYTALFAGIGALLHLAIVIPRNKPAKIVEAVAGEEDCPAAE